ncbi:MAG: glucose 1-dehydrogenase [Deltaproteobacteria bacterium]|jgi:3alpha(or 20beta)-hydroxysteroid dehydrogenase|nr:glucose 1-dehydrogenase [Deltaproteobacteria bacterium]MBW2497829.1 glucose 1-dehydrogenase [Deltaproteobacteria bacterium]
MTRRLDGKVVIITGAARGQGAAEARLFATEGARLVLGDVLDDEGRAVAGSLGDVTRYLHLDVTSEADWSAAVELATSEFGGIDALVNNAGILHTAPLAECKRADFERVLAVNLTGPLLGMQAVIEPMAARGGGSIVNVSSVSGLAGTAGQAAYASSKFGLRGLTKVAAVELGPRGIRVNSIHPGIIDTPMNAAPELAEVDWKGIVANLPLPRQGEPEDIAKLALFLCSDDSAYSTGSEFVADGGLLASP